MTTKHHEVWQDCLETIKSQINEKSYSTWFLPIKPVNLIDNVLTIQVPNRFFYEFVEEHFVHILKRAIRQVLGQEGSLEYQIMVPGMDKRMVRSGKDEGQVLITDKKEIRNPFVIPGTKKVKIDPQLNPKYRFENLIEDDCNKLARSAGMAISKNPGRTSFNPLFLFGDVGLGKTHLAQAVGNEVRRLHEDKVVLYVTTEKFTNQIIQAIKNNAVSDSTI